MIEILQTNFATSSYIGQHMEPKENKVPFKWTNDYDR